MEDSIAFLNLPGLTLLRKASGRRGGLIPGVPDFSEDRVDVCLDPGLSGMWASSGGQSRTQRILEEVTC